MDGSELLEVLPERGVAVGPAHQPASLQCRDEPIGDLGDRPAGDRLVADQEAVATDPALGSLIEGVEPTFENISDSSYGVSRSLFVYAKDAHIDLIPGAAPFIEELVSTEAMGEYGYLTEKGLIPLSADELSEVQARAKALTDQTGSQ